jgi:hypothetical protein
VAQVSDKSHIRDALAHPMASWFCIDKNYIIDYVADKIGCLVSVISEP